MSGLGGNRFNFRPDTRNDTLSLSIKKEDLIAGLLSFQYNVAGESLKTIEEEQDILI